MEGSKIINADKMFVSMKKLINITVINISLIGFRQNIMDIMEYKLEKAIYITRFFIIHGSYSLVQSIILAFNRDLI